MDHLLCSTSNFHCHIIYFESKGDMLHINCTYMDQSRQAMIAVLLGLGQQNGVYKSAVLQLLKWDRTCCREVKTTKLLFIFHVIIGYNETDSLLEAPLITRKWKYYGVMCIWVSHTLLFLSGIQGLLHHLNEVTALHCVSIWNDSCTYHG